MRVALAFVIVSIFAGLLWFSSGYLNQKRESPSDKFSIGTPGNTIIPYLKERGFTIYVRDQNPWSRQWPVNEEAGSNRLVYEEIVTGIIPASLFKREAELKTYCDSVECDIVHAVKFHRFLGGNLRLGERYLWVLSRSNDRIIVAVFEDHLPLSFAK